MLARVWSASVRGTEGYRVAVEVDLSSGLPTFTTVGLPDSAVRESRERVASALRNSGYELPCRRVTVNLAPAQFRKSGTQFDLPVALGLLAASGQLEVGDWAARLCFLGALALDGGVEPVPAVLPMADAARRRGARGVLVPRENAAEAASAGVASYGVSSLREAVEFVTGRASLEPASPLAAAEQEDAPDLSEVRGQALAKRALEVAAAGGHNLLLIGPPGSGKSMLARRLGGLLPPLDAEEALEVAKIRSVLGRGAGRPLHRPFREPHHTVTPAALVGGGDPPRPGEITLAHGGVLFLDELAEFRRESLEALRAPLEEGRVLVSRSKDAVQYPARFLLAAAMNPCPCGYLGHPRRSCACTPGGLARYRTRLSGPLLDRMDLRVEVSPLGFREWEGETREEEGSARVRERVLRARRLQAGRRGSRGGPLRSCRVSGEALELLESAAARLALSARGLDRVVRVSRTVADLDQSPQVLKGHLAEALALSGRESGRVQ